MFHPLPLAPEMSPTSPMRLSQGQLNVLSTCPRKFQHIYLQQLGLQPDPQQWHRLELGSRFHQLMQQRELGLSVTALAQGDQQLDSWLQAFENNPPPMIEGDRLSEHRRILPFQDFLLVAVYDLLIEGADQAQILDWKTYARPPQTAALAQNWQTRLYPFILSQTSDYAPEQIRMTYWFAEDSKQGQGHSLSFSYSHSQQQQTAQQLTQILTQLGQALSDYAQAVEFPQVAIAAGECVSERGVCSFAQRCGRLNPHPDQGEEMVTDIDAIPEIPL
jgi:hypothetical protein